MIMGMHFKTSYNHRERALSQLADLYSSAEHSGMLSQEISERRNKIMETIAKCPQWVHSFLEGWERCKRSQIERKVVFCYTMPDGRLLSTHRDRDDHYEKHGLGPKEVYDDATHSGHYWDINGSLRPYFVSAMNEEKQP